jgi:hypothetical protein
MSEDPHLAGRVLPDRLHILMRRMREGEAYPREETDPQDEGRADSEEGRADSEEGRADSEPGSADSEQGAKTPSSESETPSSESEEGKKTLLRNRKTPSSESEAGLKPAPEGLVRNPEAESTVRTVLKENRIEVRTVPRARELDLRWPERFLALKEEQQAGGMIALQQVDETLRQAVLDEWAARCADSRVRHPAGYLFGIIQKALRGEFKAWVAQEGNTRRDSSERAGKAADEATALSSSSSVPADREVARTHLARLASILKSSGAGERPKKT